jgi:hypothetical protein
VETLSFCYSHFLQSTPFAMLLSGNRFVPDLYPLFLSVLWGILSAPLLPAAPAAQK